MSIDPIEADPTPDAPTPLAVRLWFGWAFTLLAITGLLLGRIVEFIDFSERAPFSLLGIFMMIELAAVLFGITTALQRKRIAHRFAIGIALGGGGGLVPADGAHRRHHQPGARHRPAGSTGAVVLQRALTSLYSPACTCSPSGAAVPIQTAPASACAPMRGSST
jgi:hypothetical protein